MLTDEMKAAGLTEAELHILQHSLGVDQYGQGEQYRNTDIRKAELDPSTFAHPEEFQREPYNPWGMRLLLVWCVGAVILGGWAVVKLIEWVL